MLIAEAILEEALQWDLLPTLVHLEDHIRWGKATTPIRAFQCKIKYMEHQVQTKNQPLLFLRAKVEFLKLKKWTLGKPRTKLWINSTLKTVSLRRGTLLKPIIRLRLLRIQQRKFSINTEPTLMSMVQSTKRLKNFNPFWKLRNKTDIPLLY